MEKDHNMDTAIIIITCILIGYWLGGKMGIGRKKTTYVKYPPQQPNINTVEPVLINWSAEDMAKIADAFMAIQMELEGKTVPSIIKEKTCVTPPLSETEIDDIALNETIQEVIREMAPPNTLAVADAETGLQKLGYKKPQIRKAIANLDIAHKTSAEIITQALPLLNK